jgi:drug/metabolite transporter (DMT)-like permease
VYLTGKRLPASIKTWGGYAVMGLLNKAIPFSLIVWGQTRIESGVASILNATTPIFTVLLAHFLTSDERLTTKKITGVLICSSIIMLPLVIFVDSPWSVRPSLEALSAVLGIAVISTAIAYLLYFHLLATAGATNVLLVTFLIPISALLLGVGILGEVIKVLEYAGMGCIFLGLIIIDGRALNLVKRLNGRRAAGKREEAASKAAS